MQKAKVWFFLGIFTVLASLGAIGCSKNRDWMNPLDASGPDSKKNIVMGNGWKLGEVSFSGPTQYYSGPVSATQTVLVQDDASGNTTYAYLSVDLSSLPSPVRIVSATLDGDYGASDFMLKFGILNAPFSAATTWASKPGFDYVSSFYRYGVPSYGGCGWLSYVRADVTSLVAQMVSRGAQNYGFVIYGNIVNTNPPCSGGHVMGIYGVSLTIVYHPI